MGECFVHADAVGLGSPIWLGAAAEGWGALGVGGVRYSEALHFVQNVLKKI